MKRWIACLLLLAGLAHGPALSSESVPTAARAETGLSVSAPSALLMEKETGTVLYEKNAHTRLFPASVTKVMTMLLIAEDVDSIRRVVSYWGSLATSYGIPRSEQEAMAGCFRT